MEHMIEFVKRRIAKKPDTAGVIYTYKRDLCNELAGELRGAGVDATPYHGGLSKGDRESVLRGWTDKKVGEIPKLYYFLAARSPAEPAPIPPSPWSAMNRRVQR